MNKQIYNYKEFIHIFPSRNYYIDNNIKIKINSDIFNKKNINLFPIDIKEINLSDDGLYGIQKYKICIFGVLEDMSKITIILDGIEPYFDIKLNSKNKQESIEECEKLFTLIKKILNEKNTTNRKTPYSNEVIRYDLIENFKYYNNYNENTCYFARFYFLKNRHRCQIINTIRDEYGRMTAEDDNKQNYYYRVVLRTIGLKMGEWCTIKNYTYHKQMYNFITPVFRIKYNNIINNDKLLHKKVLCMYWDIETYNKESKLPDFNKLEDNIFMISISCVWLNENKPLFNLCFVDMPSEPRNEFITVICNNEVNLIKSFIHVIQNMLPDFIIGFNDSRYDWKWLIYRSYIKYPGLIMDFEKKCSLYKDNKYEEIKDKDKAILKKCFISIFVDKKAKYDKYKKEDEDKKNMDPLEYDMNIEKGDPRSLIFDGFISFDLRTSLMKVHYEHEKSSLNHFLSHYGLGSKNDMDIKRLFNIYKEMSDIVNNNLNNEERKNQLKIDMSEVAYYCVVDSFKCHELVKKSNLILNGWEMANISYVSFKDTIHFESGIRVRNAVMRQNLLYNVKGSNISYHVKGEKKYPGAHVFPPIKGLVSSKLSIDERINRAKEIIIKNESKYTI